tara:strand:+ start:382 stop:882 length:501 start_codon:yes stop_codon:yes gene_type:complete
MNINIIAAVDSCNGIGLNNNIPWYEPDDLKFFSKLTRGNNNNAIVMGLNTWNSLPKKPLPNRANYILTTTSNIKCDNTESFTNSEQLLEECLCKKYDAIWIIGGGKIYKHFIDNNNINKIYLSKINSDYNCDTFFPCIPEYFKLEENVKINNNVNLEIYKNYKSMS